MLAAAFIAILVYANSLQNGVFDDITVIQNNHVAHDPFDWHKILFTPSWFAHGPAVERALTSARYLMPLTGSINTRAALKGICRNGAESYEHLYRAEGKRGAFVIPSADENEMLLNETLSEALNSMLADRDPVGCLAQ